MTDIETTFCPYVWTIRERSKELGEAGMDFYISGLDTDGKTICIRVDGYHPHVYVQLPDAPPSSILASRWNKTTYERFFSHFVDTMKSEGPITWEVCDMKSIYSLEPKRLLKFTFPTYAATRIFASRCTKKLAISQLGLFEPGKIAVHEHNIDPIVKFAALKNLNLTGWLNVKGTPEDFSTAASSLAVHQTTVKPVDMDMATSVKVVPKYMSFDIECYSDNHNSKLPQAGEAKNAVFHISAIVGRFGSKKRDRYLLTLFDPLPFQVNGEDVDVRAYDSEEDLLLAFTELIQETDPDIFLGYNIMKFDWSYLISRAELHGIAHLFLQIGRLKKDGELRTCTVSTVNWSSGAYGKQEFRMPDVDRTQMDLLVEVERNYKLSDYKLDTVAKHFIGTEKVDITPKQLFKLYQLTLEESKLPKDCTKEQFIQFRTRVAEDILVPRYCTGDVKKFRDELLAIRSLSEFRYKVREAMTMTAYYCTIDSELVVDIAEKLNVLTAMKEFAGVTCVPLSYLQTRGQQIKVLAQIYRFATREGIFISSLTPTKEAKYVGATVISVRSGKYKHVITLDFASLYPSIIIARNICYTTFRRDVHSSDKDFVVPVHSHRGCPHDETVRKTKVKEAEKLCNDVNYVFRRPKYLPNGEVEGLGLLPRLLKNLLMTRKKVKKEMEEYEARIQIAEGKMPEGERKEWEEKGVIVTGKIDANTLTEWKTINKVLDARQLALKVASNSTYGSLGVAKGFLPLTEGAAAVTATGREMIAAAIDYIVKKYDVKGAQLVYGDTDSCFIEFSPGLTKQEIYALGTIISKETSHFLRCRLLGFEEDYSPLVDGVPLRLDKIKAPVLPKIVDDAKCRWFEYQGTPMSLEFEKMFGDLILFTKKRYIGDIINSEGKVLKTLKKGVMIARRDNAQFMRDTYIALMNDILKGKGREDILRLLCDKITALYTRQVKDIDLVIVVGVRDVREYANKKVQRELFHEETNPFIDKDGNPFSDPLDALDPRLVYANKVQAQLCLRMLGRGDVVPANTRVEFVLLDKGDSKTIKTGDRAEDYAYFKENRSSLKIDYHEYVRKLETPINELIRVSFPVKTRRFKKDEQAFLDECVAVKNEFIRSKLDTRTKLLDKLKFVFTELKRANSWEPTGETVQVTEETYKFINRDSLGKRTEGYVRGKQNLPLYVETKQKEYVVHREVKLMNIIRRDKYPELVRAAQRLNSRLVMREVNRFSKIRNEPERAPKTGIIEEDVNVVETLYNARVKWARVVEQMNQLFY